LVSSLAAIAVAGLVARTACSQVAYGRARVEADGISIALIAGPFRSSRALIMLPDGRQRTALREPLAHAAFWAFSPSGAVAVATDHHGSGLFVGHTPRMMRRVANGLYERPMWSPDGRTLAVGGPTTNDNGVFTLTPEAHKLRLVVNHALFEQWVSNTRFAFVDHGLLYTVGVDGRNRRRVPDVALGLPFFVSWSPDGRVLAYGKGKLLCLKKSGSRPRCHEVTTTWAQSLAWSPRGDRLAFVTYAGVWLVNRDGGGLRRVFALHDRFADNVEWSPDGSELLFERERSFGMTDVCVAQASKSDGRCVARARTEGARAAWVLTPQLRPFEQ
jgi:WD40 repeat protein